MTRIGAKARAILTGITLVACLGAGQAVTISRPAHVAWSLAWHASLPYSNSLVSVTSTGTGDIWAVGLGVGHHGSYAVHWNGRRWRVLRFPDLSFVPGVVSASSPDNVWVTGSTPQSSELAYRWDGRAWRQLTMPVSVGADNPLVVLSLTDVWITGGYGMSGSRGCPSCRFPRRATCGSRRPVPGNATGTTWTSCCTGTDCAGGIYSPNLVDMHGVPGRYRTLWAAACSRRLNGRMQGVILASKVW